MSMRQRSLLSLEVGVVREDSTMVETLESSCWVEGVGDSRLSRLDWPLRSRSSWLSYRSEW